MMNIPNVLLSIKLASDRLNVSEQHVRTLVRDQQIEALRVGRSWVIREDALDAYLTRKGSSVPADRSRPSGYLPKIKALSFFSGAMGLDLGLEQCGIHMLLACEIDKSCRKTIAINRPDLALLGDIWAYTPSDIRTAAGISTEDEIDVMVGGPPCQAFSTAGTRRGFKDDRGNALLKYVDLILELQPRYAVIENVRGLMSAPMSHTPHSERGESWVPQEQELSGGALLHVIRALRSGGYSVSFNLYNAANFGVPQSRERVVIICYRGPEKVPHLMPTHALNGAFNLPKWKVFKDAVEGMEEIEHTHVEFPESRLRYFQMLRPGQYWKHLPEGLQKEALGNSFYSGGGKTGFLRRLDWDKPCCTLVTTPNMPATDICHPVANRPLSIQEYKRIQQFPDDWQVCGSLSDQYRQIGNAVPVGLGAAVGHAILNHMSGKSSQPPVDFPFSRYKGTDETTWERQILRNFAGSKIIKHKVAKQDVVEDLNQLSLELIAN